ncbi:MAG: GntR family transcriptional regulator, partial [Anaerolineae bacterium]|nr:GntR family transcriptional regulator [Anaerolineae bacterium]
LVDVQPYRGCTVRGVDLNELAEILQVRIALEAEAARVATSRLTHEQLAQLELLADECDAACVNEDPWRGTAADLDFHWSVVQAAGNGTMSRLLCELYGRTRVMSQGELARLEAGAEPSHHALLAAFRSGDEGQAAAVMAEHIACQRRAITQMLESAERGRAEASGNN